VSKKVLIATEKPFAPEAAGKAESILKGAGYEVARIEKYADKADLLKAVAETNALIVRSDKVDATVLEAAPELKIVVRAGAGYDNVDCAAAKEKGVVVMNTPGQNANAVAELALGMMVFLARNCFDGKPGTELMGKTLGLLGFGAVGKAVCRIANGFGMRVVSLDPYVTAECMEQEGASQRRDLQGLLGETDYLSLHIPATPGNVGCIKYETFMQMKKGACLVNTARAEILDEEGLVKAFTERHDLMYASDIAPKCAGVFREKFPGRFYFTPKKLGAQTAEANMNAGMAAANQIIGFFEKGDTTFQVNK